MGRFLRGAIGIAITQTIVLWVLSWILPGLVLTGLGGAIQGAVWISLALAVAWPFIYRLSARFHPLVFPLITFGLTGLLVYLIGQADWIAIEIDSFWTGLWVSVGLTAGNVIISALFSLNDDHAYDWFVVRPLRRHYASTPKTTDPGVLYLEIDGLAEPILRQAIEQGYMPTLGRWLSTDSHQLIDWQPDLSSQTSASQAGILLGDNTDIPAFRWYDKKAGKLMVTSKLETASEVEHRLSTGQGLLADGGASRWNIFSGDAPDCLCTYSAVGDKKRITSRGYVAYFSNPYSFSRALALFVSDVVRERWQARAQVRRDELPRIHRHFKYALVRAGTTTMMQEASLFMLIADMYRGVPAVYNTFFAYDEVAHHSGIDRPDALKVLRTLDRVFASLESAEVKAPRPYHLVVLSDHGQSMGATFRQRYGQSLSELVSALVSDEQRVSGIEAMVEDVGAVNLALSEAARQDSRTARLLKRSLRRSTSGDEIDIGRALDSRERQEPPDEANVVVLASGNLGLISFLDWKERMTYEQIVDAFPNLLPGLMQHEGIGFVMVHSSVEGGLVLGPGGIHYLDHGYAVGTDPLLPFGANAAHHLKRASSFSNAPDILVNSLFNPATGEVAAFEELVGCHGGLGGPQTRPFLLYPSEFPPPEGPIVGTAALHRTLKGWQGASRERPALDQEDAIRIVQQSAYPAGERSNRHVGTDAE